jgi:hypothetical protein
MITLLDIFKDLTYGELANSSIGNLVPDDNDSEPDPKDYAALISHVNRALTLLYSRFLLSSKEIYIQQYEEIAIYTLDSAFAQSNTASLESPKYIADSVANPFQDDVLKIEEVYDEEGNLLCLNDPTEDLSIFTPSYNQIQIPYPNDWNTLAVQYRAAHPRIIWNYTTDASTIEVKLPEALYQAALYFIASRATPVSLDGGASKNEYIQKYEMACQAVEKQGLHIQAEVSNWRFDNHGWV